MKEEYKAIEMPSERFFKFELDDKDLDLDNSIFEQLVKDMAKAQDIDFAKTPIVDLFTGYMNCLKYRKYMEMLSARIDKAIEYMNNYNELVIPTTNIKSLVLKEEYKKIIHILQGEDNEQ